MISRKIPATGRVPRHASAAGVVIAAGLLLAAIPGAALAGPDTPRIEVGRSALVVNKVVGAFGDEHPTPIKRDDEIVFNEDITTGAAAKTTIRFRDGSTFALGPDAVARIDSFVFNPNEGVGHKTVSISKGVFRYISGMAVGDQDTKIRVNSGTLVIRGSVVSGVVSPGVPPILYLGQGDASFTNQAGSTDLQSGDAIAVPSQDTAPMRPSDLPPAVMAQVLQVIEPLLPPVQTQVSLGQASAVALSREGSANLLPAAIQQAREAAAAQPGRPASPPAASGNSLARQLSLLVKANAVGLLNGAQTERTPQQQAFLAQAARTLTQALPQLAKAVAAANAAHDSSRQLAAATVAQGLAAVGAASVTQTTGGTPATGNATAGQSGAASGAASPQVVQATITAPGINVSSAVLQFSEADSAVALTALQTALNVLGAGTGAAGQLVAAFANDIGNVADCDPNAGRELATALQTVLRDPGFAALTTGSPAAVALASATVGGFDVTPVAPAGSGGSSNASAGASATASGPGPGTATFGSFGSAAGTAVATSPAS